ncbi:MAG: helix-turn-helix domain-containing protein [Spirochaetaceae bacterium]|nr:MAG: helix-turn-helix domain-containing protein [Spirochaetaceae bacterium]
MKPNPRERKKNVALIIETSNDYARGILRGIHDYTRIHPEWTVYLTEHGRHEPDESFVGGWEGDGVIARIETERTAEMVQRLNVPTVDVSAARLVPGIPWVETDDTAITELAVGHLFDCGLRNIAFFGDPFYNWSNWRELAFRAIMQQKGHPELVFLLPVRRDPQIRWYANRAEIKEWLESLPKPVGIFSCYDACAQQLLEICRYFDIPVPEDVAVIGMDNDELLCELATPTLTSVVPNSRATGFLAAELLDRMMSGEIVSGQKHSVKPLGVKKRVSTDILTVDDPHVARAVAFIRANADRPLSVENVLASVPLSRRIFESRFRRALDRTPHQEIVRVRTNRVRELLLNTDMTLAEIAETMGIEHPEYVSVFFKKETGMTPVEYRNQARSYASRR